MTPEDRDNLIRKTVAKDLSNEEFEKFKHIYKSTGLDPLLNHIYCLPLNGRISFHASIDACRMTAERTGKYSPGKETVFEYDAKGKLISATAFVKKMTPDGTWHEIGYSAFMSEFGSSRGVWATKPRVMLSKCAEMNALRRAFPAELSGLYAEEELDQEKEKQEKTQNPKVKVENTKVEEEYKEPITEQEEIDEEKWAVLDFLCCELDDKEAEATICRGLKIDNLYEMKSCDYERVFDYLNKKLKAKRSKQEQQIA
jgi:phage recombination protein Bet